MKNRFVPLISAIALGLGSVSYGQAQDIGIDTKKIEGITGVKKALSIPLKESSR